VPGKKGGYEAATLCSHGTAWREKNQRNLDRKKGKKNAQKTIRSHRRSSQHGRKVLERLELEEGCKGEKTGRDYRPASRGGGARGNTTKAGSNGGMRLINRQKEVGGKKL